MLAEFLDRLVDLANQSNRPPLEHDGQIFVANDDGDYSVIPNTMPTPLQVKSLSAINNYLHENRDELDHKDTIVHVESPWLVSVRGTLMDDDSRAVYMQAKPPLEESAHQFFGRSLSQEEMIVALQTRFRMGPNLQEVLRVVGSLAAEAVKAGTDDGVSQEVTMRSGKVLRGVESFKNPATLVPRRSFPEIALDEVPFILRFTGGDATKVPTVTLHEADGGAWQVDAMQKIAAFLAIGKHDGAWGIVV